MIEKIFIPQCEKNIFQCISRVDIVLSTGRWKISCWESIEDNGQFNEHVETFDSPIIVNETGVEGIVVERSGDNGAGYG